MRVWLVFGQTGEYSDHSRWAVAAYADEAAARRHADLAKEWEVRTFRGAEDFSAEYRRLREAGCPYDAKFCRDYTGTDWSVEGPFELLSEAPAEVKP